MPASLTKSGSRGDSANLLNNRQSDPQSPWLARGFALVAATSLHFAVWYAVHNQPATVPARTVQTVEVALVAAPKRQAQPEPPRLEPPPPPQPPEKPAPKKLKSLPKPKPLTKAEPEPALESKAEPPPTAPAAAEAAAPAPFQEASFRADYLQNPRPAYPAIARDRRWQGTVYLRTQVQADGTAGEVRLERSSGHDALDEVAMEAVKRWRFVPAKQGDKAVESWVIIPIDFKLTTQQN